MNYTDSDAIINKRLSASLAILGIGMFTLAVIIATKKSGKSHEKQDVENYDIAYNKPFIYSICE